MCSLVCSGEVVDEKMALGGLVAIVAVVVVAVAFSAVHKVHEGHVAVYYRGGALLPVIEVGRAHRLRSGSSLWASMVLSRA